MRWIRSSSSDFTSPRHTAFTASSSIAIDDAPTHKELIHAWASQQWRQRIEATYLRHHYSMVATQKIAYVEVYEHMSLEVKMVDTRCRGEIWCGER